MYLALTDLYRAKWTDAIHEEWMRNVRKDYPDITQAQVERVRDLMNAHVRDCLVTGYEDLIGALTLPDPDDRHVLAAAIRAGADVIVTTNLAEAAGGAAPGHPLPGAARIDILSGVSCPHCKRDGAGLL
jgi:hypothetical protein